MELHSWINSLASGLAVLGVLWLAAVKITRLEVKVDTMWAIAMKRALAEGIEAGLIKMNSPVRLEAHSQELFAHLADELEEFGKKNSKLTESNLMLEIEREFGQRLLREVCLPNKLPFGVCLLIATAIAKGGHTLTEILDEYHVSKH